MDAREIELFAVYLGGYASKCNTELYDVAFVVGERIEVICAQLRVQWFGSGKGLQ